MYFIKTIAKTVAIITILSAAIIFGDDSWQYGTNKIYDSNTSGCLGIGTASPSYALDITRTTATTTSIRMTNANTGSAGTNLLFMSYGTAAVLTKYGSGHSKSKHFEISGGSGPMTFLTGASPTEKMRLFENGNVCIGVAVDNGYKLAVNGTIHAKEVKVDLSDWSDFVFNEDYHLKPLNEIEEFIKINKHLPEIPSAKEVEANGVALGEMQAKLLQKVEELTLYMIELKKENDTIKKKLAELDQ